MAFSDRIRRAGDRLRERLRALRDRFRSGSAVASRRPSARSAVRGDAGAVGRWGEENAVRHLEAEGLAVTGTRVRFGRFEIDIVALDRRGRREEIVFAEVKTRSNEEFGAPLGAVDRRKRQALRHAAMLYLRRLGGEVPPFRIDVVEVVGTPGGDPPLIRHHRNAVPMPERMTGGWTLRRKRR